MLFTTDLLKTEDLNKISNYLDEFDTEIKTVDAENVTNETPVYKYISSLVSTKYEQAVYDIENTVVGSRRVKKRSLQQVMKESFFSGANRFGNNFIA